MKNCLLNWVTILLVAIVCVGFASCGGGDDSPVSSTENPNDSGKGGDSGDGTGGGVPQDYTKMILGSWKCNTENGYTVITFKEDGLSEWKYMFDDEVTRWTWSYEIDSKYLSFDEDGEKAQYNYTLTANSLSFDGDEYVKTEEYTDEEDPSGNSSDYTGDVYDNRGAVAKQFRGRGTETEPYVISDATELRKLADDVESGKTYHNSYFRMTADIVINFNVINSNGDLNGNGANFEQWKPIGKGLTPFCGTFDGNGHSISGIYIKKEHRDSLGLFGFSNGTIQNVTLKDSYIVGYNSCGGIVGYAGSKVGKYDAYSAQIYDCTNYATVYNTCSSTSTGHVGGITGYLYTGTIKRCSNYGKIASYSYGGGIVGYSKGNVHSSINKGNIIGLKNEKNVGHVGGITGYSNSGLRNCANYGYISGNSYVGGIVGQLANGVLYCVNIGNTKSETNKAGAIVFKITARNAAIRNCYYLNTSGNAPQKEYNALTIENCISMTSSEMKSQSFLDKLNASVSTGYSYWKFGSDGYPVLEWVN